MNSGKRNNKKGILEFIKKFPEVKAGKDFNKKVFKRIAELEAAKEKKRLQDRIGRPMDFSRRSLTNFEIRSGEGQGFL